MLARNAACECGWVSRRECTQLSVRAGSGRRELVMSPLAVVELRPLLITRLASMVPGVVLVGFGIEWWFAAAAVLHQVGAAVLAGVGVALSVRGYRLGVRCDSTTMTVRGLFWGRRIPRSSIRAITYFPAVRWSSRSGRIVWTPIIAFAEPWRVIPQVQMRNEEATDELRQWVGRGRGSGST